MNQIKSIRGPASNRREHLQAEHGDMIDPIPARRRLRLSSAGGSIVFIVACASLFIANAAKAQPPGDTGGLAPSAKTEPSGQPAAVGEKAAVNNELFFNHANKGGVQTCAATYSGLGINLTNGTQYMLQTQFSTKDADKHSVQGLVGMMFNIPNGYSGPAAGVVFATPTVQGCEGLMVRIVPLSENCADAEAKLPQGSVRRTVLSGNNVFALSTGGQAILMPAITGCIAISIVRSAE